MRNDNVKVIDSTVNKTYLWLKDFQERMGMTNENELALSYIRACLITLRDRMVLNESAQLGAQLPILLRGFYYEGFSPRKEQTRERTQESFYQTLENNLTCNYDFVDNKKAFKAAFDTIFTHITEGEVHDIVSGLNDKIKTMLLDKDFDTRVHP